MPCTREELINLADQILSSSSYKDYCPNGLQVQGGDSIHTLVTGVTACQALLDAALAAKADAILVHHGYFWRGEAPALVGSKYQRVFTLMSNQINLVAYHLPLDAHSELGNNAQLGRVLGLQQTGTAAGVEQGLMALGTTVAPLSGEQFAAAIADKLGRVPLHINAARPIKRLAWCTGGAQNYIDQAIAEGVDAYISGEISEQTTHSAREAGIHYFAAGHHATERYGVQALGARLALELQLEHQFIDVDNPA